MFSVCVSYSFLVLVKSPNDVCERRDGSGGCLLHQFSAGVVYQNDLEKLTSLVSLSKSILFQ